MREGGSNTNWVTPSCYPTPMRELSSRICRSKPAKTQLLCRLYRRLWRGDVPAAIAALEAQRPATKNEAKLDELIAYLQARAPWIPNYRQRRIAQQYIGSAHVEKAKDCLLRGASRIGGCNGAGRRVMH